MKTKSSTKKKNRQFDKHYKVIAILLVFFAVLLLLALLSYTKIDEENAKVTLSELFGLLSGEPIVEAKAATTQNWLGLVGAWMSYNFYVKTIGFAFLPIPLFIIAWSRYLFSGKKVSTILIKYTTIYLVVATLFAGLLGSINTLSSMAELPREWSGAVGQLLASIFTNLLGSVGAIILFIFAILITLYLGTDFKFTVYIKYAKEYLNKIISKIKNVKENIIEDKDESAPSQNSNFASSESVKVQTINQATEDTAERVSIEYKEVEDIETGEIAKEIVRKPNIIINRGLANISTTPQNKSVNPFDKVKNDELTQEKEITKEEVAKKEDEYIVPEFKPNFKNLETEAYSNLDFEDKKESKSDKDYEQEEVSTAPIEVKSNELANVAEGEKKEIDIPLDDNIEKESTTLSNIKEESISLKANINVEDNEVELAEEAKSETYEDESISEKKLNVTVNKLKPEKKEPVFLIGTAVLDEEINYQSPGLDLLVNEKSELNIDENELKMNAQILQEKLETFKIYIENLSVTPGPVVTQYEFVPAAGIKISKIESLSDDLAMALKAKGIRIIAPIPGKGTIGVEIPNSNPSIVRFAETVDSAKFINSKAKLPLALGKTISGEVYIADLAKMPHLLIAGSTGSGKSVGINTIISSLVYKLHPSQLKFVIIDPKKVELQSYSKLQYHYIAQSPEVDDIIVTKPEDAVTILKAAVAEMELRYDILASVRQRNISDYNEKVKSGKLDDKGEMEHRPMPYIVVIIDELADLMLTASKEIEEPITRLAQMARAVGIHLVVATQRPSVDVITGIIKANFPARIAYLVASKIDSRTILDMQGADQLLGQGDMLCLPPGSPKPVRLQNAFITTDEVENICDFIGDQEGYSEPYFLPSLVEDKDSQEYDDPSDRDVLFEEAARLIVRHQQGSVSLIQRKMRVGYARAGRIVDELERAGIVGPFDGSKARIVLIESEADLERII